MNIAGKLKTKNRIHYRIFNAKIVEKSNIILAQYILIHLIFDLHFVKYTALVFLTSGN